MTYGVEIVGLLPTRPDPGATAVYRFYDAEGVLLYIGICDEPVRRWYKHADKAWWPDVACFKVVWFCSRDQAETAEADAIITEKPVHNVALNGIPYNGSMFPRVHLHRLTRERFGDRPFTMADLEEQLGIPRGSAASKTKQLVEQGKFEALGKMKGRSGRAAPHYRALPAEGEGSR